MNSVLSTLTNLPRNRKRYMSMPPSSNRRFDVHPRDDEYLEKL